MHHNEAVSDKRQFDLFFRDVFERLIDCEKVNGLVIIGNETDRPGNFSPDSTSPNARYGMQTFLNLLNIAGDCIELSISIEKTKTMVFGHKYTERKSK